MQFRVQTQRTHTHHPLIIYFRYMPRRAAFRIGLKTCLRIIPTAVCVANITGTNRFCMLTKTCLLGVVVVSNVANGIKSRKVPPRPLSTVYNTYIYTHTHIHTVRRVCVYVVYPPCRSDTPIIRFLTGNDNAGATHTTSRLVEFVVDDVFLL